MPRKTRKTSLSAPYLTRVQVRYPELIDRARYPFSLPWVTPAFEFVFDNPVTLIVGANGSGKSTFLEALAALAGFGASGGNRNHAHYDDSADGDLSGAALAECLGAAWLPKITRGWFFRADTYHVVERGLAADISPLAGGLDWSHGEGTLRQIRMRTEAQGLYIFDEPESALSPKAQLDFLALLAELQSRGDAQVVLATHAPLLMALPGASLLHLGADGFAPIRLQDTEHFRIYANFVADPDAFVEDEIVTRKRLDTGEV